MTIKSLSRIACLTALSLFVVSCSNDDDDNGKDPDGTITINMMDENNGKSELGSSDIYIDKAYNFTGYYSSLASLGKKNGLGNLPAPALHLLNNKAAVESGNAYQIFKSAAVRTFPSGKLALNMKADYYNVFVVSLIKKNDAVVGATVKFAVVDAPSNGLPEYESKIGVIRPDEELIINLPTSDFEYEALYNANGVSYAKKGKQLVVNLTGYYTDNNYLGFYIRIGASYTYAYVEVKKW